MAIKELTLKITDPGVIAKIAKGLKDFKDAADEDGQVDRDHLADVLSESDFDYDFVQDILSDAFLNAGVLVKEGRFEVKIVPDKLDAMLDTMR